MKRWFLAAAIALAAWIYFRPLSIVHLFNLFQIRRAGLHREAVQIGPYRIEYLTGGKGSPLVMVHGIGSSAEDGALLYPTLASQHRIYAPDLLGYGGSDKPDADYSIALQSEVLRQFLDAVNLKQTDMMAVSMGGWVALRLAAEHPERVRRLALVASGGLSFKTSLSEETFAPKNVQELRRLMFLQSDTAARLPAFVLRDLLRRSKQRAWINQRSMRSMLSGRDLLDGKLQRVRMPVLLLWGTNDRLIPFEVSQRMKREMPQAEIVGLRDCGHLAIIECRDRALPALLRFFR